MACFTVCVARCTSNEAASVYARWQLWHLKGLSLLCCRLWDWGAAAAGRKEKASMREEASIRRQLYLKHPLPVSPQAPAAEEGTPGSKHRDRTSPSSPPPLPHTCPFLSCTLGILRAETLNAPQPPSSQFPCNSVFPGLSFSASPYICSLHLIPSGQDLL